MGMVVINMKKYERPLFIIWFVIMLTISIFMILPLIWTFITSITPNSLMSEEGFLPSAVTLDNYSTLFNEIPMIRYIFNSLFLAVTGVILNVFFGSMGGYAFAKLRFKGKKSLFLLLMASMMIAGVTIMIPQYILLKSWPLVGGNNLFGIGGHGLLNNYLAIILPGAAGAYAIFMMRQFYLKMPIELLESARIDGLSEFNIYRKIFLPLSKPALTTLALITFQSGWNSFMWPLVVLSNKDWYTVQLGLSQFAYSATNRNPDYGALMAGSIIVILPMLILFIFGSKYFTEGLAFSGGKE